MISTISDDITELTTEIFEDEVFNQPGPVLIAFYATWCGSCRQMGPIISSIAVKFSGKLRVVILNVDLNDELAGLFRIQRIPSVKLIANGRIRGDWTGLIPEDLLTGGIHTALELTGNCTADSQVII